MVVGAVVIVVLQPSRRSLLRGRWCGGCQWDWLGACCLCLASGWTMMMMMQAWCGW